MRNWRCGCPSSGLQARRQIKKARLERKYSLQTSHLFLSEKQEWRRFGGRKHFFLPPCSLTAAPALRLPSLRASGATPGKKDWRESILSKPLIYFYQKKRNGGGFGGKHFFLPPYSLTAAPALRLPSLRASRATPGKKDWRESILSKPLIYFYRKKGWRGVWGEETLFHPPMLPHRSAGTQVAQPQGFTRNAR